MTTLSYGFFKPANGDKGSVFFPAMATNMQKLNDHTHNGVDSALLTAIAFSYTSQTIASASWVNLGVGTYRQTVTVPGGISLARQNITFKLSTGSPVLLTWEYISDSSYFLYINDNTQTITANYGT